MTANEFSDLYEPQVQGIGKLLSTYLGSKDLSQFSFMLTLAGGDYEVMGAHSRGIPSLLHMEVHGDNTNFSCHIELSDKARFVRAELNKSVIESSSEGKIRAFMNQFFKDRTLCEHSVC